jgi:hypothetical protein
MKPLKTLAICVIMTLVVGCTAQDKSKKVLESQGYTEVQMTGYSMFSCDENDSYSDEFTAKSPNGVKVQGAVCSGIFKGYTIRFE